MDGYTAKLGRKPDIGEALYSVRGNGPVSCGLMSALRFVVGLGAEEEGELQPVNY